MAVFTLDVEVDADNFEQLHELDGSLYLLRFQWNRRDESWSVSFYQPDGTALATGRKIVVGVPLLRGLVDDRLPPGMLLAVDTTGADRDPGRDDLGVRVLLAYYDAEEMAT